MGFRRNGTKYNSKKCEFEGKVFDSKIERDRFIVLRNYERNGIISNLRCQVKYNLAPKVSYYKPKQLKTKVRYDERELLEPLDYVADFVYEHNGQEIVEDVKGIVLPEFRIKQKMMFYIHGIYIHLIFKPNTELPKQPILTKPE